MKKKKKKKTSCSLMGSIGEREIKTALKSVLLSNNIFFISAFIRTHSLGFFSSSSLFVFTLLQLLKSMFALEHIYCCRQIRYAFLHPTIHIDVCVCVKKRHTSRVPYVVLLTVLNKQICLY